MGHHIVVTMHDHASSYGLVMVNTGLCFVGNTDWSWVYNGEYWIIYNQPTGFFRFRGQFHQDAQKLSRSTEPGASERLPGTGVKKKNGPKAVDLEVPSMDKAYLLRICLLEHFKKIWLHKIYSMVQYL